MISPENPYMEKKVVCILSNDGKAAASLRSGILKSGFSNGKTLSDPADLNRTLSIHSPSIVIIDTGLSSENAISRAIAMCDAASVPYLLLISEKRECHLKIPEETGFFGCLTAHILPGTLKSLLIIAIRNHQKSLQITQDATNLQRQSTAVGIIWWEWTKPSHEICVTDNVYESQNASIIPSEITQKNQNPRIFDMNKMGFLHQNLSLKVVYEHIHPDYLEQIQKAAESCISGITPGFSELCSYNLKETIIRVLVTGTVTGYDGDKPTRIEGIIVPVQDLPTQHNNDLWESDYCSLQQIWDGIPYPFTVWEVIYEEEVGRPVDLLCHYCNKAFATLFNKNPIHLQGANATTIFQISQVPFLEMYAEVSWSFTKKTFQCFVVPREKWYEVHLFSPVRGMVTALSYDITDKIHKQEEKKRRLDTLQAFHAPSNGTFVWDQKEKVILIDWYTASYLDISPEIRKLSRENLLQLVHPDDQERASNLVTMLTDTPVITMKIPLRFRAAKNWISYIVTVGPIQKKGVYSSGGLITLQYQPDNDGNDPALSADLIPGILSLLTAATTYEDAGSACIPAILQMTGMNDGFLIIRNESVNTIDIPYRTGISPLTHNAVQSLATSLIADHDAENGILSDPVVYYSKDQLIGLLLSDLSQQIDTGVLITLGRSDTQSVFILLVSGTTPTPVRKDEILCIIHQIWPAFHRILLSDWERKLLETLTLISYAIPDIPVLISEKSVQFLSGILSSSIWKKTSVQEKNTYKFSDDVQEALTQPLLDAAQPLINRVTDEMLFGIEITMNNGERRRYAISFKALENNNRRVIAGYIKDITRIADEKNRLLSCISEIHREEEEVLDLLSQTGDNTPPPYGFLLSPDARVPAERLSTLAYVHRFRYLYGDENEVNADNYLCDLSQMVLSWIAHPSRVLIILSAGKSTIRREHLITVSLITSELITHALRHAFTTTRSGTITISFSSEKEETGEKEKQCHLVISNDGIPMPDEWDPDNSEESGILLIYHLVQVRLGGTIRYNHTVGTTWDIRYPGS